MLCCLCMGEGTGGGDQEELKPEPVPQVDLDKYVGNWYQVGVLGESTWTGVSVGDRHLATNLASQPGEVLCPPIIFVFISLLFNNIMINH